MPFIALEVAHEAVRLLREPLAIIARRDPPLADQLRRASQAAVLNLAEARRRRGRDQAQRIRVAAGEAGEARAALDVALAWRHITPAQRAALDATLDRVRAMLYRLTH